MWVCSVVCGSLSSGCYSLLVFSGCCLCMLLSFLGLVLCNSLSSMVFV